jgi:hypothetical protein
MLETKTVTNGPLRYKFSVFATTHTAVAYLVLVRRMSASAVLPHVWFDLLPCVAICCVVGFSVGGE